MVRRADEVVIGLGPVGRRVLHGLQAEGIEAVGASRHDPGHGGQPWHRLDATDPEAVAAIAAGASVVHLCAAPPLERWLDDFPPIVDGVLRGLRGTDTRLVFASNLYPYGPQDSTYTEESPELATGPLGRLRRDLDARILAAGNGQHVVVRASSYFGPGVDSGMAGRVEIEAVRAGRPVPAIGSVDQPHSLTYIDDFARAMITVGHEARAGGRAWLAPMQAPITHRQLLRAMGASSGAEPRFRMAGPFLLTVLGLFNPVMRALKETSYSFSAPFVADSAEYCSTFSEQATPFDEAVAATLAATGPERTT